MNCNLSVVSAPRSGPSPLKRSSLLLWFRNHQLRLVVCSYTITVRVCRKVMDVVSLDFTLNKASSQVEIVRSVDRLSLMKALFDGRWWNIWNVCDRFTTSGELSWSLQRVVKTPSLLGNIARSLDQPAPPSVEVGGRPYLQQALPVANSRVVLALHHG